ncbi:MAG: hypothetical protein ABI186_04265 [Candidatus Elarobacter sp.]
MLATIVVVLVAMLVISWVLGSLLVRSTNSEVDASRAPAEDVTIVTADGLALGGRSGGPSP